MGNPRYVSSRDFLCIVLLCVTLARRSEGHGYMIDPPARSSMWRVGFNTPVNYNDNALRCGGSRTSCGVCGDSVDSARDHETGGRFATGTIAKSYKQGDEVNLRITVTANHQGWFYFNLCARDDPSQPETEECLDRVPLKLADGRNRFPLRPRVFGVVNIRVKLPEDISCSHCVLRWKWITGNSWGRDPQTGEGCLGCGAQEQFYGCADVNIRPRNPSPRIPEVEVEEERVPQKTTTVAPPTSEAVLTRKCLAVNNWEGDPELDSWCDTNCNRMSPRFCPSVFCACQLM
ncbi:hypothetical protein EGW08_005559 [Elysia chlorotica]|uniref:Chitin-binding type-4 domain-containing protein n=1 Tax=Elysia chlorotica TaxID=188477 RepID=A0A433TYQ1_ELYCH|nr:hypothetical protein EGW08_005559 [Elysia chlorotica]